MFDDDDDDDDDDDGLLLLIIVVTIFGMVPIVEQGAHCYYNKIV